MRWFHVQGWCPPGVPAQGVQSLRGHNDQNKQFSLIRSNQFKPVERDHLSKHNEKTGVNRKTIKKNSEINYIFECNDLCSHAGSRKVISYQQIKSIFPNVVVRMVVKAFSVQTPLNVAEQTITILYNL